MFEGRRGPRSSHLGATNDKNLCFQRMWTSVLTCLSSICNVVTLQTQENWRRGHHGAIRDFTFAFHVIKGASSGIIRQLGHFQKDVCVDAFNAFQCLSCSVAQGIHRWGPTYHWEPQSRLNRMIIKVKWEVHSDPFKGRSQPTQGFEYDDEWCHKGQRSFVGPQSRVSEQGQDQDQGGSSLCGTLSLKVWKI